MGKTICLLLCARSSKDTKTEMFITSSGLAALRTLRGRGVERSNLGVIMGMVRAWPLRPREEEGRQGVSISESLLLLLGTRRREERRTSVEGAGPRFAGKKKDGEKENKCLRKKCK